MIYMRCFTACTHPPCFPPELRGKRATRRFRPKPAVFNAERVMIPRAVLQDTFDRYLGFGNGDAE